MKAVTPSFIPRLLAVLLLLLVSFIGVAGASFANPIGGEGNGGSQGGGTGGGGGGSTGGGSGGGGSGSSGASTWGRITRTYWGATTSAFCTPDANGQSAIGYAFRYRYPLAEMTRDEANASISNFALYGFGLHPVENLGLRCHYPPSYVDSRVTCVQSVYVSIDMALPASRNIAQRTQATDFAGNQSLANCLNSSLRVPLYEDITDFGRYTFSSSASQQACTQRTYTSSNPLTGVRPPNELRDCGSPYTRVGDTGRWELTCAGFREGFSSGLPNFTMNDCLDGGAVSTGQATCSFSGQNTLDGIVQTTPAQLMRDGVRRPVSFSTPNITGNGITVNATQTRIVRDASSTPWHSLGRTSTVIPSKAEFKVFRNNQSSLITPAETGWQSGVLNDGWSVAGYWASDAGRPTLLSAEYLYDLSVAVQSVRVTGVEPIAGTVTVEATTIQVPTTASCVSPSLSIEYLRATNG